jgi:hypothetical protein
VLATCFSTDFFRSAAAVYLHKVREWLNGVCKSPNEKITKERLKGLLAE